MHDDSLIVGLGTLSIVFVLIYIFLIILWKGTLIFDWYTLYKVKLFLARRFQSLKLVLHVMFSHPPGPDWVTGSTVTSTNGGTDAGGDGTFYHQAQPLKLLFTDQTKVITSAGGQNSVTQMIGSLFDAIEGQYGIFATRLFPPI